MPMSLHFRAVWLCHGASWYCFCPTVVTPLFVQGPPGTGKTSTIVALASAFLSLRANRGPTVPSKVPKAQSSADTSSPRILVCAQSNAAVDELVLRLSKGVIDKDGVPRYTLQFCSWLLWSDTL